MISLNVIVKRNTNLIGFYIVPKNTKCIPHICGICGTCVNPQSPKTDIFGDHDKTVCTSTRNLTRTPSPLLSRHWSHWSKNLQGAKSPFISILDFPSPLTLPDLDTSFCTYNRFILWTVIFWLHTSEMLKTPRERELRNPGTFPLYLDSV